MAMEFALILVKHRGIVAIVEALAEDELFTRELYDRVPRYYHADLKRAQVLGLIERKAAKQEGVGQPRVYNRLTKKGRKLLEMIKKYEA